MFTVLVAESDKDVLEKILSGYEEIGYSCICTDNGEKIFEIIENDFIDLIVADTALSGKNENYLPSALRRAGYSIPVIMTAPYYDFESMKNAFLSGVDDYMIKPINTDELILRTNAVLRRAHIQNAKTIKIGSTVLNYDSLSVQVGECEQTLPQKEFYLIFKLLSQLDRTFTRQELMDEIWGMVSQADEKTVNTHINRLRKRFADSDDFSIVTVRGRGYKAVEK